MATPGRNHPRAAPAQTRVALGLGLGERVPGAARSAQGGLGAEVSKDGGILGSYREAAPSSSCLRGGGVSP